MGVCTDTRTGLVVVDEIDNISQRTQIGAEVSDTLKYFSERIPAQPLPTAPPHLLQTSSSAAHQLALSIREC